MTKVLDYGPLDDTVPGDEAAKVVGRLGVHKQAHKLIALHNDMRQGDVWAAQQRGINDILTRRLDESALAEHLGHPILGAKVYGEGMEPKDIVYIVESVTGRTARRCISLDEAGGEDVLRDLAEVMSERMSETADFATTLALLHAEVVDLRGRIPGAQGAGPRRRDVLGEDSEAPDLSAIEDELEAERAAREEAVAENEKLRAALDEAGGDPPGPSDEGPSADSLPYENYDDLAARDIVDRLTGANPDEKALVLAYEQAHGNRKTVVEAAGGEHAE